MPPEPVLEVAEVGKCFRVYRQPHHRLAEWLSLGRWRRHHEHWALHDVGFTVSAGETVGVMGRNGAGKTTLLALLVGLLAPTTGVIRRPPRVAALINLGAGFDPEANGADNARRLAAMLDGETLDPAALAEIADFAELGEAMERPFKTYSAGMQLRLAFACATRHRPDLLVIDEVLAVGDFFFRRKCHERIKDFVAQGTAAILVSHDYTEILQFCRQALVLDAGRVTFHGDAATAVNRYLHSRQPAAVTSPGPAAEPEPPAPAPAQLDWPEAGQQIPVPAHPETAIPGITVTALACCDANLGQRWVFSQGEYASLFIEAQADCDFRVPIAAFLITDERGVIVHGISSHMKGEAPALPLRRGGRLRARCDVALLLRYGEYQVDICVSDIDPTHFLDRGNLTFEELGARVRQLVRIPRVGVLAVVPRQGGGPTQLTHHGIADLPGTIRCAVT